MAITLNGTTGITTPADTITGNATVGGTLTVNGVSNPLGVPGTAGNVLTSTGSAWASSAPAATASLTLLATLTTTSGTTQSATGLATTYTNLLISAVGVTKTGASNLLGAASSNNGSNFGSTFYVGPSATASANTPGGEIIFSANASVTNRFGLGGAGSEVINTTTAAPINALRFSWSDSGTFTGGTIYIYGWN